ncbi:MAG TPA: hypothetical protein VME42_09275 [Steroidobacteraceae bacterium]|nr:hypothetical protein [Steroidobacteraceae bacterium]
MKIATATSVAAEFGPLTRIIKEFVLAQQKAMAAGISSASDWDALTEFIEPGEFKRVGAYLEEFDWPAYRKFLTGWASGGTRFEMTEFHITEIGNTVFQEIEERHSRGGQFIRKNVIAVYRFNDANKIVHLDIYEQAKDSGRWIIESANAATN